MSLAKVDLQVEPPLNEDEIAPLGILPVKEKCEHDSPLLATKDEIKSLRHVRMDIPMTVWLLVITSAMSSFARWGVIPMFQNYLQNPPGDPQLPGALNLGQATTATIQNVFWFFTFLTPLPWGIISDSWLGRYRTMMICFAILAVGYLVLVLTSIPVAIENGAGLPGFLICIFLIGIGQGGLSAVMYPLIGDQIPDLPPIRKKLADTDEVVVQDRDLTTQYVFTAQYWGTNVAAFSLVATPFMERKISFWSAYLMPVALFIVSLPPILLMRHRLVKLPPNGNVLTQCWQVFKIACRSGFHLSAAEPAEQETQNQIITWDASFVSEIRRGLPCMSSHHTDDHLVAVLQPKSE